MPNEADILEWWKNKQETYPILSIMARKWLAIPATTGSIERNFNTSGNIITKQRNRLSGKRIKELLLLKSWGLNNNISYNPKVYTKIYPDLFDININIKDIKDIEPDEDAEWEELSDIEEDL